jgi:hypothetical protein
MLSAAITAATSTATTVGAEAGRDGPGHHRPHTDGCGQGPCSGDTAGAALRPRLGRPASGAGVVATVAAWPPGVWWAGVVATVASPPGVGWAGVVATVAASPPGVLCAVVFAGG